MSVDICFHDVTQVVIDQHKSHERKWITLEIRDHKGLVTEITLWGVEGAGIPIQLGSD